MQMCDHCNTSSIKGLNRFVPYTDCDCESNCQFCHIMKFISNSSRWQHLTFVCLRALLVTFSEWSHVLSINIYNVSKTRSDTVALLPAPLHSKKKEKNDVACRCVVFCVKVLMTKTTVCKGLKGPNCIRVKAWGENSETCGKQQSHKAFQVFWHEPETDLCSNSNLLFFFCFYFLSSPMPCPAM